ncbi:MAG: THUMP domain-containing protein [Planctomycetales bacterium]|nr:THUMP domain-containing protein [Planctomycetales bacterium]
MTGTAVLTTARGLADVLAREATEAGAREVEESPHGVPGWVRIRLEDPLDLARLVYRLRVIHRGILLLAEGAIPPDGSGPARIADLAAGAGLPDWIAPGQTFAVRCRRRGEHGFRSRDVEEAAGAAVVAAVDAARGERVRARLEDPDVLVRCDVAGERAVVGLDFVGVRSLHRRGIYPERHRAALKATVAAALVRLSGWDPEREVLADPLCGGGTIVCEAALLARRVPGGSGRKGSLLFERLRAPDGHPLLDPAGVYGPADAEVRPQARPRILASDRSTSAVAQARANAAAAGVSDLVSPEPADLPSLPARVGTGSIHRIVTNPPFGIRMGNRREMESLYPTLCCAAAAALSPGGTLTFLAVHEHDVRAAAAGAGLRVLSARGVSLGGVSAKAFVLGR